MKPPRWFIAFMCIAGGASVGAFSYGAATVEGRDHRRRMDACETMCAGAGSHAEVATRQYGCLCEDGSHFGSRGSR